MSTRVADTREWMRIMRGWGFTVLEAAGWEARDAEPGTTYDPSRMFLEHHDASTALSGRWGALAYVTREKLAQLVYSRDGQAMVVAAGITWHAGVGGPFMDIPRNAGNRLSMAVEVANSGSEPYAPALTRLIIAGEAAWCLVYGRGPERVRGHKEWATPAGRKTDPSVDMNQRRRDVAAWLTSPTATGGFLMALTDAQQQEIYDWLRGSHPQADTLTVLYRQHQDMPRAVWWDAKVTRAGEDGDTVQVPALQELADTKTLAASQAGQIAGMQAALAAVATGQPIDLAAVQAAARAGAEEALAQGVGVDITVGGKPAAATRS